MTYRPTTYELYGMELSPFSVKVRSYLRYKQIPHEWIVFHTTFVREPVLQAQFKEHAKLPLIPLLITPEGEGLQDSTPILETLEQRFPTPSIHPADRDLAFLSALIEEFGDEWGLKWMFHYRWSNPNDGTAAGRILASESWPPISAEEVEVEAENIRRRMAERLWFVGSSDDTQAIIESSLHNAASLLDAHLQGRPYLFGARPAFADFALWGPLYNGSLDATAGAILRTHPNLMAWIDRMLTPSSEGSFETWDQLIPTLEPFIEKQVGALLLPWVVANEKAAAAGSKECSARLESGTWIQNVLKYNVRSLATLRERRTRMDEHSRLDALLERTDCLRWLDPTGAAR